jgi:hypothetical protein
MYLNDKQQHREPIHRLRKTAIRSKITFKRLSGRSYRCSLSVATLCKRRSPQAWLETQCCRPEPGQRFRPRYKTRYFVCGHSRNRVRLHRMSPMELPRHCPNSAFPFAEVAIFRCCPNNPRSGFWHIPGVFNVDLDPS